MTGKFQVPILNVIYQHLRPDETVTFLLSPQKDFGVTLAQQGHYFCSLFQSMLPCLPSRSFPSEGCHYLSTTPQDQSNITSCWRSQHHSSLHQTIAWTSKHLYPSTHQSSITRPKRKIQSYPTSGASSHITQEKIQSPSNGVTDACLFLIHTHFSGPSHNTLQRMCWVLRPLDLLSFLKWLTIDTYFVRLFPPLPQVPFVHHPV